jgi:hypothetical protein
MDIVITNSQEKFLCVIENKVDSAEGWEQLKRYSEWLEEQSRTYLNRALCFLTITGVLSKTIEDSTYFSISYHQDIAVWLEGILDQIQAPGVQAVVHQYQSIAVNL